MKAIHNLDRIINKHSVVVLYPKDTEKWKQFTTGKMYQKHLYKLFCIPKILKNESNSQRNAFSASCIYGCFVSQRYWKMKAIHNCTLVVGESNAVVLYPKDTEKWKQFTTVNVLLFSYFWLFCIPKILKNESNSQRLWSIISI